MIKLFRNKKDIETAVKVLNTASIIKVDKMLTTHKKRLFKGITTNNKNYYLLSLKLYNYLILNY